MADPSRDVSLVYLARTSPVAQDVGQRVVDGAPRPESAIIAFAAQVERTAVVS